MPRRESRPRGWCRARDGPGRGAVQRRADLKHRRQRFDVRGDELGRVLRDVPALCDDQRDRVAHVADIGIRQRAERSRRSHRAHHRLPHRMQPRVQVSGGEHGDDSGQRPGLLDVDAAELAVCHGAADERRVQHAGHDHVVDVASAPGQQPRVLPAAHRLADVPPRGHGRAGGRAGDLCTAHEATSLALGVRIRGRTVLTDSLASSLIAAPRLGPARRGGPRR